MPSFHFTVPGQPISLNHAYEIVRIRTAHGYRHTLKKKSEVEPYQIVAMNAAARAKPDDFAPKGLIRVRYFWFVKRDIDCSNATKIIEDGIAAGLKVNDKLFLPTSIDKQTGYREPYTYVEVEYEQ